MARNLLPEEVTGILSTGAQSRAAWTSHPGPVVPTTGLVKHDIYVQEVPEKSFGPSLMALRGRFGRAASWFGAEKPAAVDPSRGRFRIAVDGQYGCLRRRQLERRLLSGRITAA